MSFNRRTTYFFRCSTVLWGLSCALITPLSAHAFDPNEGELIPTKNTTRTAPVRQPLPSISPLISPAPQLTFAPLAAPLYTPLDKKIAPATPAPIAQQEVAQPIKAAMATPPSFPPVDAATAQRAAQELAAMSPPTPIVVPPTPEPRTFIAPAPLVATTPSSTIMAVPEAISATTQPAIMPSLSALPSEPPAVIAPAPLSDASKKILSTIPSKLDTPAAAKSGKLAIKRMSAELQALEKNPKVESFDSGGLSIKVQRPGLDTNFELNRAYTSLMGGDTAAAIDTYKNILTSEPSSEDALFGLASTYHRIGNIDQARPYYASLLKLNPNHREGLNNFLALISDESPQEALAELERLEQRNPEFSPIPAQEAVLLNKIGYTDRAREKMLRAIELAPDNLTYKYNLAIMLDKAGNYADASALYRLLIDAALNGQKIPASAASLQKRLNFIASVRPNTPAFGS